MRRVAFLCLTLLLGSCTPLPQQMGLLEGHVTMGPLVPVVQEGGPEPTSGPEVYATRQIVIYAADGQTEVARVEIDGKGNYQVTLPVGTYVVDINQVGIDVAKELPKTVEIAGGQTARVDAGIGTRMRYGAVAWVPLSFTACGWPQPLG